MRDIFSFILHSLTPKIFIKELNQHINKFFVSFAIRHSIRLGCSRYNRHCRRLVRALIVFLGEAQVAQKFRIYALHRLMTLFARSLNPIAVILAVLIVIGVVL